jgi:hypothetical protein
MTGSSGSSPSRVHGDYDDDDDDAAAADAADNDDDNLE